MELDRTSVEHTRLEFMLSQGELSVMESDPNSRRKSISVFNTVERLNKSPSVYINYLRVSVAGKGMTFTIMGEAPKAKREVGENVRVSGIMEAADIRQEPFEEIFECKKLGKTTALENLQAERHY